MKITYIIIITILSFSCTPQKNKKVKAIIKQWNNKEIIFPNLNAKYMGRDTIIPDFFQKNYKILTYIDTTGCTPCKLQLLDWKLLIKEIKKKSPETEVLFVLFSKNYKEFEELQQKNHFEYPVFYDPTGELDRLNNFPNQYNLNTFLLNKTNHVIAIGNPIHNEAIYKLYKNIIQDNVSNK